MARHKRPLDINTTYAKHTGIDYPYPSWHPIPATGSGRVSARGRTTRGGNYAYVIYDDGQVEGNFHLVDGSGPGEGARVTEGQTVCYVGSTGNSTGPHLHHEVEVPQGSLRIPPDYWNCVLQGAGQYVGGGGGTPTGKQRVVGPNPANGRSDPSTANPVTQVLDPGTVANMDGWIYGENVQGNSTWFRGAYSGDWFWSGGFTDTGTHDLTDLNTTTPTVGPKQRQVGVNPANGRSQPTTTVPVVQTLEPHTIGDMKAWAHGESVQGQDLWYQGAYSGNWFWSGGFTEQSTHDLPEDVSPEPPKPAYTFEAFSSVVTEVIPCAETNFEYGKDGSRFPTDQTDVVLHDYGTYNQDTYEGTVSWFQNVTAFTSAHFVISRGHRTQMVSLADRAFHAGPDGNWFIGIEIDPVVGQPVGTPGRQETIDSVNMVLDALRAHYGLDVFVYHRHTDFMATSCGDDIHFEDYPQGGIIIDPCEGCECPECPEVPAGSVVVDRDFLGALNLDLDAASGIIDGILDA